MKCHHACITAALFLSVCENATYYVVLSQSWW